MAIIRNVAPLDLSEVSDWRAFMRDQPWDAKRWKSPLYGTVVKAYFCGVPIGQAVRELAEHLRSVGVSISAKALRFHSHNAWCWARNKQTTDAGAAGGING